MLDTRLSRRPERGAAAVEFALLVPVVLLLVFGIISYGYMLSFRQALSQAAAEGSRAAVGAPDDPTALVAAKDAVKDALESYAMSCAGPYLACTTLIAPCVNSPANRCITVSVSYPYRDHSLLPSVPGLGATLPSNLSYTAVTQVS